MTATYSPGSSRLQVVGSGLSRLRSSSVKKPPEPLRRAVADCLSSASASGPSSFHHGSSSTLLSEASRTLRVRNCLAELCGFYFVNSLVVH
ncbi:hypothetical protein SLEP1_g5713 [Rubroshorea leprosula]|uniref:Uncharacterized protein n=1 Tax=Rubroshorea leprosula TaxID=152421 RepID=A0AAV5HYN5_9ROSI|nr:hypothetical protein SLEP1_g5713 [Rubroshorea leprosula]